MRWSAALLRLAGLILPPPRRASWGAAMRAELEVVPAGTARLVFASGCVGAAMRERARVRAAPLAFRALGLGLVAVSIVQAGVESDQWLNGDQDSRHTYLQVVTVVLGLSTLAILRLTASGAGVRPIALGAGAAAGVAAAGVWASVAVLSPSMPRSSFGAVLLAAVAGLLAGRFAAARTASARQGWLASVVAAATTTSLTFATAELLIQRYPGRIPNLVGPVMLQNSTVAQVSRENRIEIVDGYVALLFLGAAMSVALVVMTYVARDPRRPVPESDAKSRMDGS
jgi:hypothetical protein